MLNAPDTRNLRNVVLRLNFDDRAGRCPEQVEVLTKSIDFATSDKIAHPRLHFLIYGLRWPESMMFINFPLETLQEPVGIISKTGDYPESIRIIFRPDLSPVLISREKKP